AADLDHEDVQPPRGSPRGRLTISRPTDYNFAFLKVPSRRFRVHELKLFAGLSNPRLAKEVCDYLKVEQGDALVTTFSDGEIRVQINENVRGKDVFLFQSSCDPVNRHMMELLLMMDAL